MIVNIRYNNETRTADIVNTETGETLLRNIPLREIPDVLHRLRHEIATAAKAKRGAA
jgi:hypothetical protein